MEWTNSLDEKYIGSVLNIKLLKKYEVIRIRKVSKLVYDLTGKTLLEFITNNDDWVYDSSFLEKVFTGFDTAEPKINFDEVRNINYILDHRGKNSFFRNLMLGWAVEDLTRYVLLSKGLKVELFESVEKKRSISTRPKQLPDLIINDDYYLEVVQTYMNEFSEKHVLRLRGKKYERISKYKCDVILYDFSGDDVKASVFNIIDDVIEVNFTANAIVGKRGYIIRVDDDIECFECSVNEAVDFIVKKLTIT